MTTIKYDIEDKARRDAGFAIAFAILELADATQSVAKQLQYMGAGTDHAPGTTEMMSKALDDLASSVKDIASAIETHE